MARKRQQGAKRAGKREVSATSLYIASLLSLWGAPALVALTFSLQIISYILIVSLRFRSLSIMSS